MKEREKQAVIVLETIKDTYNLTKEQRIAMNIAIRELEISIENA